MKLLPYPVLWHVAGLVLTFVARVPVNGQENYAKPYSFSTLAGTNSVGTTDGDSRVARFCYPTGVAVDDGGNIYVADQVNQTVRKITPEGIVSTIAGQAGASGAAVDTGSAARFWYPSAVVVDRSGNVYVTDGDRIRKIAPDGTVASFAGAEEWTNSSGTADGVGTAARFSGPAGLAVDNADNVYVADTYNCAIRKITPAGVVTTVAGRSGGLPGTSDGIGGAVRFNYPTGVAADAAGNVYVADTANNTIRKIDPEGMVTTLAGLAGNRGAVDGVAAAARFDGPASLAVDAAGNVYVADAGNNTIRRVAPDGTVSTVAGAAANLPGSVDATGANARFWHPTGLTIDRAGMLYVADSKNNTIRKATTTGIVTTVAGAAGGFVDGVGGDARFSQPIGVVPDGAGGVFVADSGNGTIRRITADGRVTTFAGAPGTRGTVDGSNASARFFGPAGLAIDAAGNLYVADELNNTVRKIDPTGRVSTLAGDPTRPGWADGAGGFAQFNDPTGVAVDKSGNVFVADRLNHTIRKISPAGVVSTLAGAVNYWGYGDGTGRYALFWKPQAVAVDSMGNVFVADTGNHVVRKITPEGVVTTFAGVPPWGSPSYGPGSAVRFSFPYALAIDEADNVYVLDYGCVRRLTPAGVPTCLAGSSEAWGYADGTGKAVRFLNAYGVAVDRTGAIYVADTRNNAIRKGVLVPMPPVTFAAQPGEQVTEADGAASFAVQTTGAALGYRWQVSPDGWTAWEDLADSETTHGATTATLTMSAVTGSMDGRRFRCVVDSEFGTITTDPAKLIVRYATLVNLSARAFGGVGDRVAIGGFVIDGTMPKRILLRALGPTLTTQGIAPEDVMPDPTIEVHDATHGNTVVAAIDNWTDNPDRSEAITTGNRLGAAALASQDVMSAAILLRLQPGGYTFLARDKAGRSGVVLIEAYDADAASTRSDIVNLSTRAYCSTGSRVAIGGYVVSGNMPKRLLVRAVGPTLSTQGLAVADVLQDPMIEVHDMQRSSAVIATNDDWNRDSDSSTLGATTARVGATPLASSDATSSALVITLQPGVYSFVATGKAGTSGIVLIEVYDDGAP